MDADEVALQQRCAVCGAEVVLRRLSEAEGCLECDCGPVLVLAA